MVDYITQNIYLVGIMGSWKTTVAKKVSIALNIHYTDIDHEIESDLKMSIREIFNLLGEKKFRMEEHRILKEIGMQSGNIVSTGGGVILQRENRQILKDTGYTIFLDASPGILADRIKNTRKRPLLNSKEPLALQFQGLWEKRKQRYLTVADHVLKTDDLTSDDVARHISQMLKN